MRRITQRAVKQTDFENALLKERKKKKKQKTKVVENATVGKYL